MAHEIESMMYVGEAPWHRLGVKVETAPTAAEAIKLAGLDWSVGLKPLFTSTGERVDDAQLVYRESDGRQLGTVGMEYSPLQNTKAFDFFNPFIQSGLAKFETAGSLRDGRRVFILAKIDRPDSIIVPQSDDRVTKYLLLSNSHDGSLAIRVGFTPIRVVCSNTLALAHSSKDSQLIKVYHKGDVGASLDKIQEIVNLADQRFESTAEQYRFLAARAIDAGTLEKYVRIVFEHKPVQAGETPKRSPVLEKVQELFERGRGNDMAGVKGTWWAAYNAVTEQIQHHRGDDEARRLDGAWFGQGAQTNKRALEVAMTLAA